MPLLSDFPFIAPRLPGEVGEWGGGGALVSERASLTSPLWIFTFSKKISTNVGNVGHSVTAKSFKAVKVV